jgi:heat shock protein HslJ
MISDLRSRRSGLAPLVALAVLALGACGADAEPAPPAGTDSTADASGEATGDEAIDGAWRVIEGSVDGEPVALISGHDITLDIDGTQIGGTAACNSYGGRVELDEDTVAISELSWTEMGCEPDIMELEQAYLGALPSITSWSSDGAELTLTGADSEWTLERLAPVPTAELVGTTWVLDTFIDGDAATSTAGMQDATLTLEADGTLSGSTGCRRLEGRWVESGAQIVFTEFAAIDDPAAGVCSPEGEELDERIVTVLGDGFGVEIDGERLTVTSQGGRGLSYRAAGTVN